MRKTTFGTIALFISLTAVGGAASATEPGPSGGKADTQFLGIDLDTGRTFYNGRNSGVYCLYRTVRVFNAVTGYVEWRRARRCGRGLYL